MGKDIIKRIKDINLKEHKLEIVIIIVLIIGILVRILYLDKYPNALNCDEASSGYEAYSLLKYGVDRNGNTAPAYLVAWGSGQSVLYSILEMGTIAIFGLSVFSIRLPMAIIGCISLVVFYLLLKRITNKKVAIIGLMFLAICPWHIMKSRWGLEANVFTDIFLLSVFFIVKGLQDKKKIYSILGYVIAGISAYGYATSFFFLPLFFIPVLIIMAKKKQITWKTAIINLCIVGIVSLPLIIFVIINTFDLPEVHIFSITIPRLTYNRYEHISYLFSSNSLETIIDSIKYSLTILVWQYDRLEWNAMAGVGTTYLFSIIFFIYGIFAAIKNRKEIKYGYIMGVWLIVSLLLVFTSKVNINRINIIYFPIIFYTVYGIYKIIEERKWLSVIILILYVIFFGFFIYRYINLDTTASSDYQTFEKNLEGPIEYIGDLEEEIYVSNLIKTPYMYILFYTEYDTVDFIDTVEYYDEDTDFRQIRSFGKYNFQYITSLANEEEKVYLIERYEFEVMQMAPEAYGIESVEDEFDIVYFEDYVVLERKEV